ncbi:MAG: hypothetical protein IJB93_01985, partial [Clostridia bacterium]|nr:hypothetical protein [Clostridia bacterium]
MKKSASYLIVNLLLILCLIFSVSAEALSIPDARKAANGTTVTVTGYAFSATDTPGTGFADEFYLSNNKAQGICVTPAENTPITIYKEYSVTGTLTKANGEIRLSNAVVTAFEGNTTRKYKRLTCNEATDYEIYGGTFARVIGTATSPVTENGVLKSFILTDENGSIRVVIPDNVLSLSQGAEGKAELTEALQYKVKVNVDGFVARQGSETYIKIKDCDDIDVQAHSCSFGDEFIKTEPSCGIDGLAVKQCSCGRQQERIIPALSHSFYTTTEKLATCTDDGLTLKLCKNCSFREESTIPKTGHNYKERTEREPTCSLEGLRVRYCSKCDFREENPIAKTNHSYKERTEAEATCEADGVKVKYCSKCDFVSETISIPKTGHNYKERTEREPTCSLEGIRVRYCSDCDFREEKTIDKTNHSFKERVEKESTCTSDGVKVKYCNNCTFEERFSIPKTGHNFKERTEREPTCSVEGLRVRYCSNCDFREEKAIDKTNHSFKERVEKEATCTSDGVKVKYCSKCDFILEEISIPKTGHNFKERTEREPTCSVEGLRVRYCSNCDFREEKA